MVKICIHNYLKICQGTGIMPPGIVDFLKGTVALLKYSKKYGYKFYINKDIHPIFKYFEDCEYYIHNGNESNDKTYELLCQPGSTYTDYILETLFKNGYPFYVLTNCFIENENKSITCTINDDERLFIQKLLNPSSILKNKLNQIYNYFSISNEDIYYCIHIRFGDNFLMSNDFDISIIHSISHTIQNIINECYGIKLILVSDATNMSKELVNIHNQLLYWDNQKIHTGCLNGDINETALLDTLTDLLILSRSKKIYTININSQYLTTFSPFISKIYNIDNIVYQLVR